MKKHLQIRLASLLFLFFSLSIYSQNSFIGVVKDAETYKVLPFATIQMGDQIATADVDGTFNVNYEKESNYFEISYIGYQSSTISTIKSKNFYTIYLQPKKDKIAYYPNNLAIDIIKKAIANKKKNNPEEKLSSFEFKTYNKLIVSAHLDSINGKIDSIFSTRKGHTVFSKIDSTNYKFKDVISKHHLFQTEKVSQFQFKKNSLKETILGTQMAGFKHPIYEIIGFNLQSFSIYDTKYELFETKYISPIANNGQLDYNYTLLDSIDIDDRPTYMIHFKNKKESNASGLEGVLYIDQHTFAIAKAIMRIKGVLDINGTQEFTYIPEEQLWFPTNKMFKIVKGNNDDDIKILGGTIQFDGDYDEGFRTRKKQPSDYVYLLSKTNNFDMRYNTDFKIKKSFISIEIKDDALNKSEIFWDSYRREQLNLREQKTYLALDSLSIKKRFESKIRFGRKIINGYVPIPYFDIDLRKLFKYNNYEGFRFGFGGVTNEQFSRKIKIDGYTGYGTKDGNVKYHLGSAVRIGKFSNSWFGGSYTDDLQEIASTLFLIDKIPFKLYDPRPINISTFYHYVNWRSYLETAIIPKTESIWELAYTQVEPKFDYVYNLNNNLYTLYHLTTAKVSLQWNPFSNYMQTPTGKIEIEKRFPKFTFQYTQALPKLFQNDFEFSKFDFKTEYEKKYLNGQKTNLLLQAGYALGDLPITHLYNSSPNNITKETILKRITFAGKNSFETMFINEFFSSEFLFFQFKHSFNRLKLFPKVKPSFVLVSRMAWGNLNKPEQHVGLDYKTLDEGFFESGLELNQIFNGLGLSAFYRYGPNQLPKLEDNIAVKLSFVFNLGF
ncbi:DUF5686 family protein [Flavobacterium sp.]|uniref:DUF5686 family protein n=1 Tax=Flavobacterium sp. TaxID=239 RepID=UPI003C467077